jgi:hypothetical protein
VSRPRTEAPDAGANPALRQPIRGVNPPLDPTRTLARRVERKTPSRTFGERLTPDPEKGELAGIHEGTKVGCFESRRLLRPGRSVLDLARLLQRLRRLFDSEKDRCVE